MMVDPSEINDFPNYGLELGVYSFTMSAFHYISFRRSNCRDHKSVVKL